MLSAIQRGGWLGVDLFFVLSGFLVSGLLFKEYRQAGDVRVWRFLVRRGWKIYPSFWAMLAASILLWDFGVWDRFSWRTLMGEVLFLQNYVGGMWLQTWSLAVEEHFYLLLAAVTCMLFRLRSKGNHPGGPFWLVPPLCAAVAVACLLARIVTYRHQSEFDPAQLMFPSHCRMDSLAFGVLVSYWWNLNPGDRFRALAYKWRAALTVLGVLFLLPGFIWKVETSPWIPLWGVGVFYVASGMLVLGVLSFHRLGENRLLRWLGRLGSYSYSVYLWHGIYVAFLNCTIRAACGSRWGNFTEFVSCYVGTWLLGVIAAVLVEIPVLKVRERYFPARTANAAAPGGPASVGLVQSA